MQEPEERRAEDAGEAADGTGDDEHGRAGREQKEGIEDTPGAGAGTEEMDDGPINQEGARKIHVEQLAIGRTASIDQEADVVKESAIVNQGPATGEDEAGGDEAEEPEREGQLRAAVPHGFRFGQGAPRRLDPLGVGLMGQGYSRRSLQGRHRWGRHAGSRCCGA